MSDHIRRTIEDLKTKIRSLEEEIVGYKKTVNLLCQQASMPNVYPESALAIGEASMASIRADTFYGQPLNTSVRRVLEMRHAQGLGPASASDIYEALDRGGFQFGASSRENAIRSLRISLTKSTHTFHKLPSGVYGLTEWYPDLKGSKPPPAERDAEEDTPEGGDE